MRARTHGCSGAQLQAASGRAEKAHLAYRLAKCADLASIHALLREEAGSARNALPGAVRTQLAASTRPADVVATFRQLTARWRSSAQGPLDAALLTDALQPAYALLDLHLPSLQPREIAAIIKSLACLRSASPEVLRRLADSLMRRPAPAPAPTTQPGSVLQHGLMVATPALAAMASPASPPSNVPLAPSHHAAAGTPPSPTVSSAFPGLARLTSPELASVVSALAAFNLRPGDAWLGLCMSCLQLGLPYLLGPQLSQLLWSLVQLGVRPTSPWLALYEEALCVCLEHHLCNQHQNHQNQHDLDGSKKTTVEAPPAQLPPPSPPGAALTHHPKQEAATEAAGMSAAAPTGPGGGGDLSCDDLVRVVSASAEVSFQPGPRCRGLLLAALGSRLRAMQPHQVATLAWAVTRLGWRLGEEWREDFLRVTGSLLPYFRAADLPAVLGFLGSAGLAPDRAWLHRCLETSLPHLPQVSPRDLPDLLWDITRLDGDLFKQGVLRGGGERGGRGKAGKQRRGRGAEAGGAGGDAEEGRQLEVLAATWLRRYLALCTEKVSRFTAAGVARMMLAVARAGGGRPEDGWLQAACATLASKSDVLAPNDMADAVMALAELRRQSLETTTATITTATAATRTKKTIRLMSTSTSAAAAAAAAESRLQQRALLEALLAGCATKMSLLPNDRLVGLVAAVAELDVQPDPSWLFALLEETQTRLAEAARGAATPTSTPTPTATVPVTSVLSPAVSASSSSSSSSSSWPQPASASEAPTSVASSAAAAAAAGAGGLAAYPDSVTMTAEPSSRSLTPRLLSELLVSVAKLGVPPPRRWIRSFLAASEPQMGTFDAESLGGLMWGLAVLDVRPSAEWTARLMDRVRICLVRKHEVNLDPDLGIFEMARGLERGRHGGRETAYGGGELEKEAKRSSCVENEEAVEDVRMDPT
ncbi:hypothetical protein VOLCADRAFT_102844 [Volvox carteri f. nagariensis]|uniref:Uncharacterized protein n=1 Tax=Volvox carteri f. nagariensis TaxID=3068 RepID=D8TIG2_VOLCA|nr:uncharacterized protein VOLCADRAFT_102844 [Volvox carteri f. nagariensis]EFJ52885.1 hypothetical protein VOLCADRAFT_102844 [Volvox carteri f. nagariensis]|eukprot:XP_002945890.1 hypothetical protein VOLCADRAFT_102844 [Volvox carteri f. nagariensis]